MRDLSLHLMDILRNCVDAGSSKVSIGLKADRDNDVLTITVDDDGRGIDPGIANCVKDPFVTTRKTRKVGLGLPLLADSARMSGGSLELVSKEQGTLVKALFSISHIDRPPLGDIGATVAGIIGAETDIRWILTFDNCNKIGATDNFCTRH